MNPTIVQIGPHCLIQGDAYAVVPTLGRFDAAVTDPPYGFNNSGGGQFRAARHAADAIVAAGLDRGFDHRMLTRDLADAVVVFCHNDQLPALLPHLAGMFERFAVCGWLKDNPMPVANRHYQPDSEFYVHAWMKAAHPIGALADKRRFWRGPVMPGGAAAHPTRKPDGLMDKIIANAAGRTVLDPFMGTGSTGVAAVKAGRVFTGVEIEARWFDLACSRVEAAWKGLADPVRRRAVAPVAAPAQAGLFA